MSLSPSSPAPGQPPTPGGCSSPLTPRPSMRWLSAGQGPREGPRPFLFSLYSFHVGLLNFIPGCPRLGPALLSPRRGTRGVFPSGKPPGLPPCHQALSEGSCLRRPPLHVWSDVGPCPACSTSEHLLTGPSFLQVCSTYLLQRGMDSRKILAHLRAATSKVRGGPPEQGEDPLFCPVGSGEMRVLAFCCSLSMRSEFRKEVVTSLLLESPHPGSLLTAWQGGGGGRCVSCRATLR